MAESAAREANLASDDGKSFWCEAPPGWKKRVRFCQHLCFDFDYSYQVASQILELMYGPQQRSSANYWQKAIRMWTTFQNTVIPTSRFILFLEAIKKHVRRSGLLHFRTFLIQV
jgi:hypothetical protein